LVVAFFGGGAPQRNATSSNSIAHPEKKRMLFSSERNSTPKA
jgi:hypothetical protein